MTYSTIQTVVMSEDLSRSALEGAAALAQAEDAHLEVVCLAVDQIGYGGLYYEGYPMVSAEILDQARRRSDTIYDAVRTRLGRESFGWTAERVAALDPGLSPVLARRARFADLVVLPRPYGDGRNAIDPMVVEACLFQAAVPVLVLPPAATPAAGCIVVGWDDSAEAMAAVRAALPFLVRAQRVSLAIVGPNRHDSDQAEPGSEIARLLSRHGVPVEVALLPQTLPRVSEVLCRHASDIGADMIVMGAYGHSRFSEAILGGATRHMLESAELPVFLSRR